MNTKEKILNTALLLYNERGFAFITSRHIADKMGISAGNLHYHFKHTDDIPKELFANLVTEFDILIDNMKGGARTQKGNMVSILEKSFFLTYKYRFIFLNLTEIAHRIPNIKKSYADINTRRQVEFGEIFECYKTNGIFREDIPLHIISILGRNIFIVSDFWLAYNTVSLDLKGKKVMLLEYKKGLQSLFFPYLTPKGKIFFGLVDDSPLPSL